jgi:hypothetical protein
VDERTRGQQALVYGEFDFGRCGERFGHRRGMVADGFAALLARGAPVSRAEMSVAAEHRIAGDDIGREMDCWPQRGCCGASVVQAVPGHEDGLPVELGRCGGALG